MWNLSKQKILHSTNIKHYMHSLYRGTNSLPAPGSEINPQHPQLLVCLHSIPRAARKTWERLACLARLFSLRVFLESHASAGLLPSSPSRCVLGTSRQTFPCPSLCSSRKTPPSGRCFSLQQLAWLPPSLFAAFSPLWITQPMVCGPV